MRWINKKLLIVLVFCIYPMWIFGNQWVGILPLSNLRANPDEDWLGYYCQARIQSFLSLNSSWNFHNPQSVRLWYLKSKPPLTALTPVNQHTTIIINGDFQKVIDLMSITIAVTKFDLETGEIITDQFQKDFLVEELEDVVDQLALKIGQWVSTDFKLLERPKYPKYSQTNHQYLMSLSKMLFDTEAFTERGIVLSLMKDQEILSDPNALSILSEAMIILSQNVTEKDAIYFQNQIDKNLRAALRVYPNNSNLLSLFAENMLLMDKDKKLVHQAAKSAIISDSNNALAYLLFSLSAPSRDKDSAEAIQFMKEINPWLLPDTASDRVQFQKGILTSKILAHF